MSLSARGRGPSRSRHRSRSKSSRRRTSKKVLKSILKNRHDSSCVLSEDDLKLSTSHLHDNSKLNSASIRRRRSQSTRSRGRSSLRTNSVGSKRRSRQRSRTKPISSSTKKVRFTLGSKRERTRRSVVWWDNQGRLRDTLGRFVRI